VDGELEVGQIVSNVNSIPSCQALISSLIVDFVEAKERISK
jgi:hypothetical protein